MLPYYYNTQLHRYIAQFISIFHGLTVMPGSFGDPKPGEENVQAPRPIPVHTHFSQMDKVSASILASNTTNKPVRIPVMSVDIASIRRTDHPVGLNMSHAFTFMPDGTYFPDDIKTVERLRPTQYILDLDLAIWCSNTEQQFQILEQILTVFNPSLQIQTSDAEFDWTKITMVELEAITVNNNYPISTNNRVVMTNLLFTMPIYLTAPVDVRDEFVNDIKVRIAAVADSTNLADILNELDDLDMPYQSIASGQDVVDKANELPDEEEKRGRTAPFLLHEAGI